MLSIFAKLKKAIYYMSNVSFNIFILRKTAYLKKYY